MTYIPVEIIITEVDTIVIEVQPEAVSQTAANLAIEAKTAIQAMLVTLQPLIDELNTLLAVGGKLDEIEAVEAKLTELTAIYNKLSVLQALYDDLAEFNALYAALSELLAVHTNMGKISNVEAALSSIAAVEAKLTELQGVYAQLADIEAVADNMAALTAINAKLTELTALHTNLAKLTAIYTNLDTITDVHGILSQITTLAASIADITTLAASITALNALYDSLTELSALYTNLAALLTVEDNLTAINAVNAAITNINTAATNIAAINTAATNIAAIIDAPAFAQLAEDYANKAEDSEVETGKYSSLHWAAKSEGFADDSETSKLASQTAQGLSEDARDLSEKWAEETEDVEVTTGKYSAKHWALKAEETVTVVIDDIAQLADEVSQIEVKDAVQSAKIRDIENILSTANLNQSAQLSVSGVSPLSLPKNAANGGMSVKMEGLTAENLVVNGDFRDGIDGWITNFEASVKENDYIKLTTSGNFRYFGENILTSAGSKYYIKYKVQFISGDANPILYIISHSIVPPTWVGRTNIVTSSPLLEGTFVSGSTVYNCATSGKHLGIVIFPSPGLSLVYRKYPFVVINLTTTFGAGNEPTKEQCDLMFADYFEGVKSFEPTGRIRSVGKNLFDKDRAKYAYGYYTVAGAFINDALTKNNISILNNIKVAPLTLYRYLYPVGIIAARCIGYDKDGAFISEVFPDGANRGSFTTPVNCEYIRIGFKRIGSITIDEVQTKGMYLERTSVAPTAIEPYRETSLYLTAPELRSNGTVKDEIRKGANGYELVKRVGVGTLTERISNAADREFSSDTGFWTKASLVTISDGTLNCARAESGSDFLIQSPNTTSYFNKWILVDFTIVEITGGIVRFAGGGYGYGTEYPTTGRKIQYLFISAGTPLNVGLYGNLTGKIDNFSVKEISSTDIIPTSSLSFNIVGNNLHFTLATPTITPIAHAGLLNSNAIGTVYHEPIIADAGVYDTKMDILLTDYPIATIEEIIKHENGIDTYLNVATAVIAGDGLSFTHPDLADGDLVLFTYAFDKESTNGNITASFYDSNVVKIDTVTGKAYRINEVVTNGILTRTLTEV